MICDQLLALGLTLDRSTLLQYERGTVGSPDPLVLWGLGQIYHVTVEDLLLDLLRDRTGRVVLTPTDPRLNADQHRAAEYFDDIDGEARQFLLTIMEALAARQHQDPAPPAQKKPKVRAHEPTSVRRQGGDVWPSSGRSVK